jgi:hypothetical protein
VGCLAGVFRRGEILRNGSKSGCSRFGAGFGGRKTRRLGCKDRTIALAARVLGDGANGSTLEEHGAGGGFWRARRQGAEAIGALTTRGERGGQFAVAQVDLERLKVEIGHGGVARRHVGRRSSKPGLSRVRGRFEERKRNRRVVVSRECDMVQRCLISCRVFDVSVGV